MFTKREIVELMIESLGIDDCLMRKRVYDRMILWDDNKIISELKDKGHNVIKEGNFFVFQYSSKSIIKYEIYA